MNKILKIILIIFIVILFAVLGVFIYIVRPCSLEHIQGYPFVGVILMIIYNVFSPNTNTPWVFCGQIIRGA